MFIVDRLENGDEIIALKKLYQTLDKNGNGEVSKAEMLGNGWDQGFVDNIFRDADINGDGDITIDEWITTFIDKKHLITGDRLRIIFDMIDTDHGGTITIPELRKELQKSSKHFTEQDWKNIVDEVDLDGDGTLDYEEFDRMMRRCLNETKASPSNFSSIMSPNVTTPPGLLSN